MDWYALFVQTGKENTVKKAIERNFKNSSVRCLLPLRYVPERNQGSIQYRTKEIFPGYIFLEAVMDANLYHEVRSIPKVIKLLNCGEYKNDQSDGYFTRVNPQEMEFITKLVDENGIIGTSEAIEDNNLTRAKIISGPLFGLEKIIKKIDRRKKRAKVVINLLGEAKLVDLSIQFKEQ